MTWPHPSIHPPIQQTIHPPMGMEFSTDFKSLNRIEISWLVQVLLNFYWFWGSGGGWMDGGGGGYRCVGVCHAHMCTHAYMHTHMHTHMHMHVKHDKHGCLHVGSHLQYLYMCVCMHVYMCGGTPTLYTSIHPPHPQSHRDPKTPKFNKSWTNRDNSIRFFTSEHSWTHIDYIWSPWHPPHTCPTTHSRGNPNRKNYNNSWTNRDNSILFEDLGTLNPHANI